MEETPEQAAQAACEDRRRPVDGRQAWLGIAIVAACAAATALAIWRWVL